MKMPVSVKLNEYLKVKHLRGSSIKILERGFDWWKELFGDLDVTEIGYSHCDDFKSYILKGRSECTANAYLGMMRPFFSWLAKRGYIKVSPMVGINNYKFNVKQFDTYKPDEIQAVLACPFGNPLYKLAFCLGLSGMRESEILNLCISDVDIEKARILVRPKKETTETWAWDVKDTQERFVGLHDFVLNLIIERIAEIDWGSPYLCLTEKQWETNIERRNSGQMKHEHRLRPWGSFPRDFKNFLIRIGIKPKRFHDSRKTFARNLAESPNERFDIEMIREALGHSSIRTTQVYLNSFSREKLAVRSASAFENYMLRK